LKIAILIDGGHLRVLARRAGLVYDPELIEKIAHNCVASSEVALRYLYYDCPPYRGETTLPVSGQSVTFSGDDGWLKKLASKDLFAVRLGVLKFRGFTPKKIPISDRMLVDGDFVPSFEQKGVDMRIGLDIANFCQTRTVDRIALITNDTDCIPAMKHARISGLQVVLARLPNSRTAPELLRHTDFDRPIRWPE
jgi:uncharacterized LabA/DUF88 family protein